tara:strand:+ start:264 stop:917 length:654 start_codon:yes stop_codon:yes gene_type:complete
MNTNQDISSRTQWKTPANHGWLEHKLNKIELDYVWKCVNERHEKHCNNVLAGNIDSSFSLTDKDNWFFNNTLSPLISLYSSLFHDLALKLPIRSMNHIQNVDYCLNTWWVNYQKENEFNPLHGHTGVYSFVLWLKIPTEHMEQNDISNGVTNAHAKSAFYFAYTDILGEVANHAYEMGKEYEGTLLFFPSTLKHTVYPFYNCSEDRISVSGNIFIEI